MIKNAKWITKIVITGVIILISSNYLFNIGGTAWLTGLLLWLTGFYSGRCADE